MSEARKTVLVVDDTPENIQVLATILKEYYKVRVANSGAKALSLAQGDSPPDLILLDIMMPEMDGYEVCQKLKASPTTREIPVVFVTAKTEAEDETRGFEIGAVDYIHKPISPPVVLARVRAHLGLREAKRMVDSLLESMLPAAAVAELTAHGRVEPRHYEGVAVLFCDLVGFTRYCHGHSPVQVVSELSKLFVMFEDRARHHGLEKIKTIGDAFLATAGLLKANPDPLRAATECALEIIRGARELGWGMRAGLHLGPVVAGVVGQERYQFDLWGDTVNLAARLSAVASEGSLALTEEMGSRLGTPTVALGEVDIKGLGPTRVVEVSGFNA